MGDGIEPADVPATTMRRGLGRWATTQSRVVVRVRITVWWMVNVEAGRAASAGEVHVAGGVGHDDDALGRERVPAVLELDGALPGLGTRRAGERAGRGAAGGIAGLRRPAGAAALQVDEQPLRVAGADVEEVGRAV